MTLKKKYLYHVISLFTVNKFCKNILGYFVEECIYLLSRLRVLSKQTFI